MKAVRQSEVILSTAKKKDGNYVNEEGKTMVQVLVPFLMVVVLHSTINVGKFDALKQDFNEIYHHLSASRACYVLEESKPQH
ncbi:hypothetical protein CR513_59274, partial [Mucuna pruriens]